jgi:hypothetical protein
LLELLAGWLALLLLLLLWGWLLLVLLLLVVLLLLLLLLLVCQLLQGTVPGVFSSCRSFKGAACLCQILAGYRSS